MLPRRRQPPQLPASAVVPPEKKEEERKAAKHQLASYAGTFVEVSQRCHFRQEFVLGRQ